MYFIKDEEDLIGKEITFIDLNRFGEGITIATKDGGIIEFECDEDNYYVLRSSRTCCYIMNNKYLVNVLKRKEIITEQEIKVYEEEQKKERERTFEKYKKEQEENEYKKYLRLKEKYEGEVK
ncbi:hypothetical protein AB8U03_03575 [Clostridium sp. Mt-5]|uniref:Uncharacterized protein n=1 Tax=Clostridium moutaii TaxID=3240932 RepID=A0ABV4BKF9_9CLOT